MVANVIKPILNLFYKPVTTTLEQANKAKIGVAYIYAGIISAIFMICSTIANFFNSVFVRSYDYSKHDYITKFDISKINFVELIGNTFKTLIVVFLIILAIAGIMYIISRILKNENSYSKYLLATSYALIPLAVAQIFSLLVSWIYAPIGMFVCVAAIAYAFFILIYAFRQTLQIENEDILTLCNVILVAGLTIILYFVAMNFAIEFLSFLS